MRFEEIDQLVRRANPVPDPSELGTVSPSVNGNHHRGGTTMQIQDLSDDTRDLTDSTSVQRRPRGGSSRRWLTGAAAAIAVVAALVTVSVVIGDDDGTDEPAAVAASPIHLADSFLAAWADFDADEATSYLSPEAIAASGGLDDVRNELRWREAMGWQWLFEGCEEVAAGTARTILRCPFSYHAVRSDELGFPPFEGSSYRIVVGPEGQITSFTENIEFERNRFSVEVFEPFQEWVSTNHPDDVDVMYTDATGSEFGDTDESIALWETRTREYVEAMREG